MWGTLTMGRHSPVKVVVGKVVLFESEDVDHLLADLTREADFWAIHLPTGGESIHSDTVLTPAYGELMAVIREHPFKKGGLDIRNRADLAIYPASTSVEGRALAHYAKTELAFAILRYLWAEAGWLNAGEIAERSDKVAEGIGELLVTAVRLGSSFR